jgi:molybdopterin-guanine dinucleotide biosynthesis protein B
MEHNVNLNHPRKILVVGKRNSGKSSTIEFLVNKLSQLGLVVGALKHSSHKHDFDKKGSDSDRYRMAGAIPSVFSTPDGCAVFYSGNQESDQTKILNSTLKECDIVLIESFQNVKGPKIWICADQDPVEIPNQTIAIIGQTINSADMPVFRKNENDMVEFVLNYFGFDYK